MLSKNRNLEPTGCPAISRSFLDRRPIPAVDCVHQTQFLLTFRSKTRHLLAVDDGLLGRWIDDAGEDGSAVAAANAQHEV
jgi:hypothetical protein